MLVVDEEIYRCLPSLLIATVDKFAQMPWNGATQMLFGQVDKRCSRHSAQNLMRTVRQASLWRGIRMCLPPSTKFPGEL